MGNARDVAIEAMDDGMGKAFDGSTYAGLAEASLDALTGSDAVRKALEHCKCLVHPDLDKCGGAVYGANVRFHLPCILAALTKGATTP